MKEQKQKKKTKVFIMDDSDIFRSGLVAILGQEEEFEVVGYGEHADETESRCIDVTPDILLLHALAREADRHLQVSGRIKKKIQSIRILVISEFTDIDYLLKIVASGCDGYVHGSISGRSLKRVIKNLENDICIFDRAIIGKLLLLEDERRADKRIEFSSRERKIVEMLAEGRNNSEIGKELHLAAGTVKNIISNMLIRGHFKNRTQLVNVLFS